MFLRIILLIVHGCGAVGGDADILEAGPRKVEKASSILFILGAFLFAVWSDVKKAVDFPVFGRSFVLRPTSLSSSWLRQYIIVSIEVIGPSAGQSGGAFASLFVHIFLIWLSELKSIFQYGKLPLEKNVTRLCAMRFGKGTTGSQDRDISSDMFIASVICNSYVVPRNAAGGVNHGRRTENGSS